MNASMPLLCLAGLTGLSAGGCNRSEAATTRERPARVAGDGVKGARVETDNYTVELRSVGSYTQNTEGSFEVVLETRNDYHINEQYPYKFTPKSGVDGVTYKGPVGREAGQFEKTKAVLRVPFTATKAGSLPVGGKLSLSVCSDKNCLMEKQELELPVTVN